MTSNSHFSLQHFLAERFSDAPKEPDLGDHRQALDTMASRGSCRAFQSKTVPTDLLETLCAVALASPSKSDLQQRDIILMTSQTSRQHVAGLVPGQTWVADAPMIAVFCGNNRRQRLLHDWHAVPFANDHLDAFFNATVDAAIALGAFVTAAEAIGLGCCPISAIRNEPKAISDLLALPSHVFPIAGLAIGYPKQTAPISKRLPLAMTVHHDRYSETDLKTAVHTYDTHRAKTQPYQQQRFTKEFGTSSDYSWSSDKVRQFSQPERSTFGRFVQSKGFRLD